MSRPPGLRNHARGTLRSASACRPRRGEGRGASLAGGGRWSGRHRSAVGAGAGHFDRLRLMPDIDALWLRLLWFGQPDRQHALLVCGFDRVAVDVLGKRERADEPSLPALASITPNRTIARGALARHHELTLDRLGREV